MSAEIIALPPGERYTFARLPQLLDDLGVERVGVVHVGAHLGEEVPTYQACGFARIVLVEPDLQCVYEIRSRYPDVEIVHAACAAYEGVAQLWLGDKTYHSGLLRPPGVTRGPMVRTVPLAAVQGDCNVAVIDTQGTEFEVLQSADLDSLDVIVIETVDAAHELPAADREQVGAWLDERGFEPVVEWLHDETGHTDTVFARAPIDD